MLLDEYTISITLPGDGHHLNEDLDEKVAQLNDLPGVIEEAVTNWVRGRIPEAKVEVG